MKSKKKTPGRGRKRSAAAGKTAGASGRDPPRSGEVQAVEEPGPDDPEPEDPRDENGQYQRPVLKW